MPKTQTKGMYRRGDVVKARCEMKTYDTNGVTVQAGDLFEILDVRGDILEMLNLETGRRFLARRSFFGLFQPITTKAELAKYDYRAGMVFSPDNKLFFDRSFPNELEAYMALIKYMVMAQETIATAQKITGVN